MTISTQKFPFLKKLIYCFFAYAGVPYVTVFMALFFLKVDKADNAKEIAILEAIASTAYIIVPFLIVASVIAWHILDLKNRKSGKWINSKVAYWCLTSCRYFFGTLIIFYGFAKLINDQLHASYYWYGDELGNLSGFQLTWAFFGYSKFYSSLIALLQVGGGLLIFSRRTTLIGALFLAPVLANIVMINFVYDISAKDIITVLFLMDLFIISLSIKPLLAFFTGNEVVNARATIDNYTFGKKQNVYVHGGLKLLCFGFALFSNLSQIGVDARTPFEGSWEAVSVKNFSDSIAEKNERLKLKLFVDKQTATIKKTYQYEDFNLSFDNPTKNTLTLAAIRDSTGRRNVKGTYELMRADSLVFRGRDGVDSVFWVFKKQK